MENVPFKETVKQRLIESSKKYYSLINKRIMMISDCFTNKKEYCIRFYETNFLHLTGVKTSFSAKDFFDLCYEETITLNDFDCDSSNSLKGQIRRKLHNLMNIDTFFTQILEVQEGFEKGTNKCLLAASDDRCTIGFADAKYYVRPKTILDKNHLDKNKPIIKVKPVIINCK